MGNKVDKEINSEAKEKLINSALYLFEKKGYLYTSVQEISEHAEMTKGGFYYYFKSKDELLYTIHDEFIEYELQKTLKIVNDTSLSYTEQLKKLMFSIWESIALYKEKVAIFFREMKYINEDEFKLIREKRDRLEECFVKTIQNGIECGEFDPDINPRITAFSILGIPAWAIHWYRPDGPLTIEEIAKLNENIILKGITNQNFNPKD
jgi:TetR/AcrR family transcriptional regulator, cholesterol catabolism regulator